MQYPRITVVTPSFNQAKYLERTIRSVLDQGYPNLEYIIMDGGSTDGSIDIIKRYAPHLAYWVSEPDHGQAHAINKGVQRATGDWLAWQNSDDVFYPNVFRSLAHAAALHPNAQLMIGNMNLIDTADVVLRDMKYVRPTYNSMLAEGMVLTNQAAFWRREVHGDLGYLSEAHHYGFDFDWFLRLLENNRPAVHVNAVWGGLRLHAETKTAQHQTQFQMEYAQVLNGRLITGWRKRYYQLRRLVLMLAQGEWAYVLRGLRQRSGI